MTNDDKWAAIPKALRYSIAGKRYVEVQRDGRGVIVFLPEVTDDELAAIAAKQATE